MENINFFKESLIKMFNKKKIGEYKMIEYKYDLYAENGDVICQECGKVYGAITPPHLSKSHNMKMAEYKEKYPDAPLAGKFKAMRTLMTMKHGNLLKEKESDIKNEDVDEEIKIDELELVEESILDEEFENVPEYSTSVYDKPLIDNKMYNLYKGRNEIIYYLKQIFDRFDVKDGYVIEEFLHGKHLFTYLSDISIPKLKIVLYFPNTFWHNRELIYNQNKYQDLISRGWKVIEIHGNNPSVKDVKEKLFNMNLIK